MSLASSWWASTGSTAADDDAADATDDLRGRLKSQSWPECCRRAPVTTCSRDPLEEKQDEDEEDDDYHLPERRLHPASRAC